jgi:septum formation protein
MTNSFFTPQLLLASKSPRRRQLLVDSGFKVDFVDIDVEEDFNEQLKAQAIPEFLAVKKSRAFDQTLKANELLVTADTVVWINDHVLNKPNTITEAKAMLMELSASKHTVYTAVCVRTESKEIIFSEASDVHFNALSESMIDYYLDTYSPLDKAGAYGIQEFIGYVGIKKIEGCYYNVMGFPVSRFISELSHHAII